MNSPTSVSPHRPRAVRHRELLRSRPLSRRLRSRARTTALQMIASLRPRNLAPDVIYFPYYHWILDDERAGFDRQLRELKRVGDFLSLDEAVGLLNSNESIHGRHFCITFDDGFRNNLTNAVPILVEHDIRAGFFLPTDLIGLDLDSDWDLIAPHYGERSGGYRQYFEYLTWDECREIHAAGMTIGAHTCSHVRLADLDDAAAERELAESKAVIERQLGVPCRHFAAPFGRPGRDFLSQRDPQLARSLGYESFLTTVDGPNRDGTSSFSFRRNAVVASQGPLLFRYMLAHEEPERGTDS